MYSLARFWNDVRVGSPRDIDRHLSALSEHEELLMLRAALQAADTVVLLTDPNLPDNPIVHVNQSFERLTGYSRDEVMGRNCRFLQNDDRDQQGVGQLREAIAKSESVRVELRNYRKDGSLFWNELYVTPVFRDGRLVNFLGIQNDVTDRKEAEASLATLNDTLEHKVKARTRQVRELAAQLTLSEVRERARLAQVIHDDLQQQLYAVGFALQELHPHLQGDTLGLERLEGAKRLLKGAVATARTTTSNLSPPVLRHEGLGEVLVWLGNNMTERYGLSVTVDAQPGLEVPNEAARVLLFGMVRELLFNIVKHAGVAQATVSLRQEEGMLRLVVQDLGSGFDTTEVSLDRLGHSEMRKRLELFGGRLELISVPGDGTRAAIVLPAELLSLV